MSVDRDFRRASRLALGPRRTAAIASWVQSLYPSADSAPILVGGAAVELLTSGGYVTGDLDFVGEVPGSVAERLRAAGFERRGRHWIHERQRVFLEFPGSTLAPRSEPMRARRQGRIVILIRPEALIADRLAAWKFWRSEVDLLNALRLLRSAGRRLDAAVAGRCARELEVEDAWRRLRAWNRRLGRRWPRAEEIARWRRGGK